MLDSYEQYMTAASVNSRYNFKYGSPGAHRSFSGGLAFGKV